MVATAIYSVTMVLWKETAFPLIIIIIIITQRLKPHRSVIRMTNRRRDCRSQHSTEQLWLFSLLASRQSSELGRGEGTGSEPWNYTHRQTDEKIHEYHNWLTRIYREAARNRKRGHDVQLTCIKTSRSLGGTVRLLCIDVGYCYT